MSILQRGKYYVLYDLSGKILLISRERRTCESYMKSMEG